MQVKYKTTDIERRVRRVRDASPYSSFDRSLVMRDFCLRAECYGSDSKGNLTLGMLAVEGYIHNKLVAISAVVDTSKIDEAVRLVVGLRNLVENRA